MNYLDTGVLVSALTVRDEKHEACVRLLDADAVTSTHALAEVFNTLTGQYRVRNDVAAEAVCSLDEVIRVETITRQDYMSTIAGARERGIMGGIVYDALHATVARRLKVKRLLTFNVSNFEHVARDLKIETP